MKCLILLCLVTSSLSQISIPLKEPGFLYNLAPEAPVKVEVFMNLLCGDSRVLFRPLTTLVDSFSENQVQLRIHMFPLPYHTYAFFAAKGAYVFEKMIEEHDGIVCIDGVANGTVSGNGTIIGNETTTGNVTVTTALNETAAANETNEENGTNVINATVTDIIATASGNATVTGNTTVNGTMYDDDDESDDDVDDDDDEDEKIRVSAFDWFALVFDNMESFKRESIDDETLNHVLCRYANLAGNLGLDKAKFYDRLSGSEEDYKDAVLAWKYGAARGVHSTPMVFINGVQLSGHGQELPDIDTIEATIAKLLEK